MRSAEVFGVRVDLLTAQQSLEECVRLIERREFAQHAVINVGKVVLMDGNQGLRDSVNRADIVNVDGMGVVWAARMLGASVPERVAGIDLMDELTAEAEKRGWPVYLLGAKEDVVSAAVKSLRTSYPSLRIAGYANGYFDDDATAAKTVRDSGARILYLGFSSPKKEQFVDSQRECLGNLLAFGVGGSFDVLAGKTRRAPTWMQRTGAEWLFRFAQEPRRMWRRYLVGNGRFCVLVVRGLMQKNSR